MENTERCISSLLCSVVSDSLQISGLYSLPSSSVHGTSPRQEHWRTLKIPVKGYSWPKDETWVSCIAGRFFTIWAIRESLNVSQITHNFKAWNNKRLLSQILWIKMQEQLSGVVLAQGLSWSFSQALGCDLILRFSWGWRARFQAVSHSRC